MLLEQYPDSGFCWKALGLSLQAQGKDALPALQKAAQLLPDDAEAHNNLGNAQKDLGQLDAAIASYRRALMINPDYALAHNNLGAVLEDLGQLDAAVASYRRALSIEPNFIEAYNNLGNALIDLGQLDSAVACYHQVLKIAPHLAEAHSNLGAALQALGRLDEAVNSLRQALEIKPDYAIAHNNMGNALRELGQLEAAVVSFRRAIEIQPNYADAHNNLGVALQALGRFDDAVASYRRALEIDPNDAEAYNNLGYAWRSLGKFDGAVACFHKALEIKTDYVEAYNNLGLVLQEIGQLDGALACYRRAIEINPDYAEAHNNLGNALKDIGQLDDAIASFGRALAIKPDFAMAHSNLLFALNYSASHAPSYCLEAARQYGQMVSKKVSERFSTWQCATKPERLRVGLVSGDLRKHPVGYFLENLLALLDPGSVELIAYPTYHQTDELTARIQPYFSAWKPLLGLNDEAAAHLIHADGVHVLLDLSGHTAKNRLPVFAWKPAPVQASWLGYFATTGVVEMDYYLADEVSVPVAQREHFTESVWYLPDTRWCFTPPDVDLPVASLPAMKNGYLTFGCFQNLAKVGNAVLMVWAAILVALPMARLRWQCKQFGDPAVVAQCVERLQRYGVDPARVTLHGLASRIDYLAAHAEVDAILDTFPFTGGTTTCEALWMGVPTISLAGDTLVARQGASLLTAAGLPDWVATSEAEYVEKAISLTSDLSKLANLRAGLRARVLASPIYDAPRFARNLEAALWAMWQARK